jgi:hypothetical protein
MARTRSRERLPSGRRGVLHSQFRGTGRLSPPFRAPRRLAAKTLPKQARRRPRGGRNRRVGASPDLRRLAATSLADHAGVAGELQSRRTVGRLGYFRDQLTAAPLNRRNRARQKPASRSGSPMLAPNALPAPFPPRHNLKVLAHQPTLAANVTMAGRE